MAEGKKANGPAGRGQPGAGDVQAEVLMPDDVIRILRLAETAPRSPREALRNLVRQGKLECLRQGPGKGSRMVFLRRHIDECLARWAEWAHADSPGGSIAGDAEGPAVASASAGSSE